MASETDPLDGWLHEAADGVETPAALPGRVRASARRRRALFWSGAAAALTCAAWLAWPSASPPGFAVSLQEAPPRPLALSRVQLSASLRADRPGWTISFHDVAGEGDDR